MITINIKEKAGTFAENKDTARDIRKMTMEKALLSGEDVELDFTGVEGATQSFMHALISETYRQYGDQLLDKISFKNCNEDVRGIINIVVDYLSESL